MRKHCGNCANYRHETNQFSGKCGKCVIETFENGEKTDPSMWKPMPQTNADRIRAMSDEELAVWLKVNLDCAFCPVGISCTEGKSCYKLLFEWLRQPVEEVE